MTPGSTEATRSLLIASTRTASAWARSKVQQFWLLSLRRISQVQGELSTRVPARAQRFGSRLWERIAQRFPSLAHLVDDRVGAVRKAVDTAEHEAPTVPFTVDTRGEPADVSKLIEVLRDPSAEQAANAAVALGHVTDPAATAALRAVLLNADGYFHPLTRVAALRALAEHLPASPTDRDLSDIVSRVRDVDAEVSMAAIATVAQHAPARVTIETLVPVMLDETGYFLDVVRGAATNALERAGLLHSTS